MKRRLVALVLALLLTLTPLARAQERAPARAGQAGVAALTLAEFQQAFARVRARGWVRSERRGPTGVGHTLERLLGLAENNIALPDLGFAELKAHRAGSLTPVTLFTADRGAWRMDPLAAVRRYGTRDRRGRRSLYATLRREPNPAGLFLHLDAETVSARHISGEVLAEWRLDELTRRFAQKFPALVLVTAESERRAGVEWFRFARARLLAGASPVLLREQIARGYIVIDLRLYDDETRARNHGTAFRAPADLLPSLFQTAQEL